MLVHVLKDDRCGHCTNRKQEACLSTNLLSVGDQLFMSTSSCTTAARLPVASLPPSVTPSLFVICHRTACVRSTSSRRVVMSPLACLSGEGVTAYRQGSAAWYGGMSSCPVGRVMKEGWGKSQAPAQRGATPRAAAATDELQPMGRPTICAAKLHNERMAPRASASKAAHTGPQPQAAWRAYLVCHYVGQHAVVTALVWRRPDGEEDDRADYSHALHSSTERLNVTEFEGGYENAARRVCCACACACSPQHDTTWPTGVVSALGCPATKGAEHSRRLAC